MRGKKQFITFNCKTILQIVLVVFQSTNERFTKSFYKLSRNEALPRYAQLQALPVAMTEYGHTRCQEAEPQG